MILQCLSEFVSELLAFYFFKNHTNMRINISVPSLRARPSIYAPAKAASLAGRESLTILLLWHSEMPRFALHYKMVKT